MQDEGWPRCTRGPTILFIPICELSTTFPRLLSSAASFYRFSRTFRSSTKDQDRERKWPRTLCVYLCMCVCEQIKSKCELDNSRYVTYQEERCMLKHIECIQCTCIRHENKLKQSSGCHDISICNKCLYNLILNLSINWIFRNSGGRSSHILDTVLK